MGHKNAEGQKTILCGLTERREDVESGPLLRRKLLMAFEHEIHRKENKLDCVAPDKRSGSKEWTQGNRF